MTPWLQASRRQRSGPTTRWISTRCLGDEELDDPRHRAPLGGRAGPARHRRVVRRGHLPRASSPRSSASSACSGCTSRATAAPGRTRSPTGWPAWSWRRRQRLAPLRLRAGLAGDVPDLEVRLRGAEAASGCRGMAAGEAIGCFGLTEPDFGSRPGSACAPRPAATATTGSSNGTKMWITNGGDRRRRRRVGADRRRHPRLRRPDAARRASPPATSSRSCRCGPRSPRELVLDDVRLPDRRGAARRARAARARCPA